MTIRIALNVLTDELFRDKNADAMCSIGKNGFSSREAARMVELIDHHRLPVDPEKAMMALREYAGEAAKGLLANSPLSVAERAYFVVRKQDGLLETSRKH